MTVANEQTYKQRLDAMASEYWRHRWAGDHEGANRIKDEMDALVPDPIALTEPALHRFAWSNVAGHNGRWTSHCWSDWLELDRNLTDQWHEFEPAQDGGLRAAWVNHEARAILTYCEGDLSLQVAEDDEAHNEQILEMLRFY